MYIDEITRPDRRGLSEAKQSAYKYFVPTADLSALGGYSAIPIYELTCIIQPI